MYNSASEANESSAPTFIEYNSKFMSLFSEMNFVETNVLQNNSSSNSNNAVQIISENELSFYFGACVVFTVIQTLRFLAKIISPWA